ncbi:MAG: S-methyl-5-thioribose-1-phosphate isomerase [Dehalococcoidia bacterium]|nr:S-methyl-5-thioribose-1-phosphate isomerase [Dehalococcoidia bacterium]
MTRPHVPYEPIAWADGAVRLLDQTALPEETRTLALGSVDEVAEAIRVMRVRGAPAIGITAAYGLALAAHLAPQGPDGTAAKAVHRAAEVLAATRPTAVNLRWAIDRVLRAIAGYEGEATVRAAALAEARAIHEEQHDADRAMAEAGAVLFPPGATVLTHCNTGPLATGGLGTALGVIVEGYREGRVAHVYADETRPRLQGARLTAWELQQHGVPFDLIADAAAASLLAAGRVQAVIVGADRIARNGDTANKVGTLGLAVLAQHYGVPFYVAAPVSTFDFDKPDGAAIPIEERDASEVLEVGGVRVAAPGASALNPAFDVTPAPLVTAFVTEAGVLRPPFEEPLGMLAARAAALKRERAG